MDAEILRRLGVALLIGLLVGFQRERARARLAGVRTFTLIAVLGAGAALVADAVGQPWIAAAALLGLVALLVSGHAARSRTEDPEVTTEVAALVVAVLSVLAVVGSPVLALVLGAAVALLLHFKEPMHGAIARLDDTEVRSVMTLVLVALLVLPLVPDRPLDPRGVLNPHQVWLMVSLIVALGLAGTLAFKVFGEKAGAVVVGLLGGLISSTATTVEQSRRSRDVEDAAAPVIVTVIASATALLRVLVEIGAVSPRLLASAAGPMLCVFGVLAAFGVAFHLRSRRAEGAKAPSPSPARLRTALIFGGLYAVVTVAVAASRQWFGAAGLSVVAVLSGLTDVDAITLSTSHLVDGATLTADQGWRLVLLATLANVAFKGGVAIVLGSRRMALRVGLAFAAAIAVGAAVLVFWPKGVAIGF